MGNVKLKVLLVAGARPNFVKIAPLMSEIRKHPEEVEPFLVHTGQHYDDTMSRRFFEDLGIPEPDANLAVGPASHAQQTARIMERFEPVLHEQKPHVVLVVGDVNSTVASALVAAKLGVKVAHVEAGLRSFDRTMPEEVNRIVTDQLSDFLFVTEQSGLDNLQREGIREDKVFLVGNVIVDTLLTNREKAQQSDISQRLGLDASPYAVVTLHRPSNVDHHHVLREIVEALVRLSAELAIIFAVHPRTCHRLARFGLWSKLENRTRVVLTEPLGYLDFLKLTSNATLILTDSGGLQEEACVLQVPCLTLRENTERPATVATGWNQVVGTERDAILAAADMALHNDDKSRHPITLWDGKASVRIVRILTAASAELTQGRGLRRMPLATQ